MTEKRTVTIGSIIAKGLCSNPLYCQDMANLNLGGESCDKCILGSNNKATIPQIQDMLSKLEDVEITYEP